MMDQRRTVVGAAEITCHAIRYTFLNKNLEVSEIPKSPQQGKVIRKLPHKLSLPLRLSLYLYLSFA